MRMGGFWGVREMWGDEGGGVLFVFGSVFGSWRQV